jgi:hypothetical protein
MRAGDTPINIFVIGGTFSVAFIAFELVAAALTFAVVANVPTFRRWAISAPITAVILAPCLLLIAGPFFLHHVFLLRAERGAWAIYGLVVVLIVAVCVILAKAAELACRAAFEYLPPWMHNKLGFRRDLLVRSAILLGGSLSLLVVILVFGWLSIGLREHLPWEIFSGAVGLSAAMACIRAFLRLRTPDLFQPVPLPDSLKRMIFRES